MRQMTVTGGDKWLCKSFESLTQPIRLKLIHSGTTVAFNHSLKQLDQKKKKKKIHLENKTLIMCVAQRRPNDIICMDFVLFCGAKNANASWLIYIV